MIRKTLFFLILFFSVLSAAPAYASEVQNCSPNITSAALNQAPWENASVAHGDDGSAWERAIINQQGTTLTVREGEPITIKGTAQPGKPVQIFIYGKDSNSATIERPSDGVCFQIATSDPMSGFFSVELDATILWPNIGREVVLDAFSLLDDSWNQLYGNQPDSNFFIGSHTRPTTVSVIRDAVQSQEAEKAGRVVGTKTCRSVCGDKNLLEGVFLDPANAPYQEISNAFNAVGSRAVSLARNEGGHTRYTGADGGAADKEALRDITYNALSLELLKQGMLGLLKTDTKIIAIDTIDTATLTSSATTAGSLAANIKTIMTNSGDANKAAGDIAKIITVGKINVDVLANGLLGALPKSAVETTWAEQFVNSLNFWTGSATPNSCLMLNDGLEEKNFTITKFKDTIMCSGNGDLNKPNAVIDLPPPPPGIPQAADTPPAPAEAAAPGALPAAPPAVPGGQAAAPAAPPATTPTPTPATNPAPTPSTAAPGTPPGEFENVGGRSPRILLSTLDEAKLTPAFQGVMLTYAQKDFDAGTEYWTLPAGEKETLYYRYAFTEAYAGDFVGNACLRKADISDYVSRLARQFRLTTGEQKALTAEINTGIVDDSAFYGVRIADQNDIATRFVWKNGTDALNLFRIFFSAEKDVCSKTDFGTIDLERNADDGFETGLLL